MHDGSARPDRGWVAQGTSTAVPRWRPRARRDRTGICALSLCLRPGRSGRQGEQGGSASGLRAQTEPLPGASLIAETAQRGQAQAEDTDHSGLGAGWQRGHRHRQPVPVHPLRIRAAPIPAFPLEDAKALLNPDPQPIDFPRDQVRWVIREQDLRHLPVQAPYGHQGAAALATRPKAVPATTQL